MAALNNRHLTTRTRIALVSSSYEKTLVTQIRLRVYIPKSYLQEPIISRLISLHNLVVNITGAMLGTKTDGDGCFDLEIRGTVAQISSGLAYLEALNLKIVGKVNVDGDSWYY